MLLAVELLRNTDTRRLERANNTYVVTFTVTPDRDPVARPIAQIVATTTCPPPHGSGRTHRVEARLYAPSGQRMPSWVTCSCEDLCVDGASRVVTEDGTHEIRELNGKTVSVLTPHGWRQGHVLPTGRSETVLVRTKKRYVLRCTKTERFLVLDSSLNRVWKYVTDLQPGDFVALQPGSSPDRCPRIEFKHRPSRRRPYRRRIKGEWTDVAGHEVPIRVYRTPKRMTARLARLLGYLVSEGCSDRNTIHFSQKDGQTFQDYVDCWMSCFPDSHLIIGQDKRNGAHTACSRSMYLVQFLNHIGFTTGRYAWEKSVPHIVFQSGAKYVREFLRAAFEGDGGRSKRQVHYHTTSSRLNQEIQQLLLSLGIVSGRCRTKSKGYCTCYHNTVSGADTVSFRRDIGFVSDAKNQTEVADNPDGRYYPGLQIRQALRCVLESNPGNSLYDHHLLDKEKGSRCDRVSDSLLRSYLAKHGQQLQAVARDVHDRLVELLKSPIRWEQVAFVGRPRTVDTYDATILNAQSEDERCFTANGFVVHNTYRWEAVLTRQNSSSLLHSNGAWPVVTNPGGRKAVCKHVARVLSRAIRDSKVIAAIRGLPQREVLHSLYPRPELQNARKIK